MKEYARVCCVCHQYKIKDQWYQANVPLPPNVEGTHTYLSKECINKIIPQNKTKTLKSFHSLPQRCGGLEKRVEDDSSKSNSHSTFSKKVREV